MATSDQSQKGVSTDDQTTHPTYTQFAAERAGLTIDRARDSHDTATNRRVERALNEDLYAEQSGPSEWIVHSGNGSRNLVDLLYPQDPSCSCEDDAQFCKHVLRIFFFGNPEFLTFDGYGVGTAAPMRPLIFPSNRRETSE